MNFEEAEERARYMISVLGKTWVMDLHEVQGWKCSVKNGPCSVTFNENSREYQAFIQLGPTFNSYSASPTTALGLSLSKVDIYLARVNRERGAIGAIVDSIPMEKR